MLERHTGEGTHGNNVVGDKEVVMKRDEQGRIGVRLGAPKHTPLLMESNTCITYIEDNHINRHNLK